MNLSRRMAVVMTSARPHLPYVVASFGIPLLLAAVCVRLAPRDTSLAPSSDIAARCPHCGVGLSRGDGWRVTSGAGYRPGPGAAASSASQAD